MSRPVDIRQIAEMLNARAFELTGKLGLRGRVEHRDFVAFNPLRQDRKLGSFRICISGAKQGQWADFALEGVKGDALDLVAYLDFSGDKGKAVQWARAWLGLDGRDPDAFQKTREAVEQHRREPTVDEQEARNAKRAFAIFMEAQADICGTPVEGYLAGRGIDLGRFDWPIRSLRFHPGIWNPETRDSRYPAMVASIVDRSGKIRAVHRTWLQIHPGGRVTKAPLEDARRVLGTYRGGTIRVWRGITNNSDGVIKRRPQLAKARPGETVILTEGIEDALSVALACPEYRVLSAISISNMANLVLPAGIGCGEGSVVICADNDGENKTAEVQLERAVAALQADGREVRLARSLVGKDFNDQLMAGGA